MKKRTGLIEWAMKYNRIVLLIVALLVLFGIYSLGVMPKQEFPVFTIREGLLIAIYPGATSTEVEEQLAKPVENFIFTNKEVNRAKTITQCKDGMLIINIRLNDNINNKDEFWSKFKHGIIQFKPQLPPGVLSLQVNDDFGDTSSFLITIESEDKTYRELERHLEELENRLRSIESVSNLREFGLQKEQISIYLDHDKLTQYGIGQQTILAHLMAQGITTVSGSIENSESIAPFHISQAYNWERDIAEQIIYADTKGNIIRLKDLAEVKREYPNSDSYITHNQKKTLLLSVEVREGSNIVQTGSKVNEILESFQQELPRGVSMNSITDQSQVVKDSVRTFLKELIIAIMAVIVIVILLIPFRVAVVSASTIPITIAISLGLFYACGIELNTFTLAALLVTLGMIVDNSIVIVDNYIEKLDEGYTRRDASIASTKGFFKSIFSATLAISITFFPFLITTTGMYREFLNTFPWAITIVLFISLAVAVLLIPLMQYHFISKGMKQSAGKQKRKSFLDLMQGGYDRLIEKCFKHRKLTLTIGVLAILTGLIWFAFLPQRLMPIAQRNQFAVEIYLPKGSAIRKTAQVADSLAHLLRQDSRILSITSFIGTSSPRFHTTYAPQTPGPNYAQFIVNTFDNEATEALLEKYAPRYTDYFPEAYVRFKQMDYSDAKSPIEIRLSGKLLGDLKTGADRVKTVMRKIGDYDLIRTDFEQQTPGIRIEPDEDEMARLGVYKASLSTELAMRYAKNGIPVTTVWDKDYPITVSAKSDKVEEPKFDDLPNQHISAFGGKTSVALRQIATTKPEWTEGQIVRRNGIRTLTVMADVNRGVNVTASSSRLKTALKDLELPQGVRLSIGGQDETDNEALPQILGALVIAIAIILFILVFHFKKVSLALLVLTVASMSFLGAAIGISIMRLQVGTTAIIGIVGLMGILVRNGIIMLDYTRELIDHAGMNIQDAALQAAKRRMRPIFLTSAAASMGVIPMILGGSTLWAPMGTVICFGTLISMILIVTILPVAYASLFKNTQKQETHE